MTDTVKRWGRLGDSCLLHNRYSATAPAEPGAWVEISEGVKFGDVYVNGVWVAPDKTADYWRGWRDNELASSDWRVTRAAELGEPVPQDWLDYRQALRDIPEQQGFPASVSRPTRPE